ncbi:CVNH domain-containing protein [Sinorhizobium meliloti]|uniref:Cyanovirin containing protein n=1 Tax=Rhizobium meliloti TaxID=382 RepID=A0A2J0YSS9_RHIML|nr:CVNH domain-containing protein [Sinorhizobium meliloti]PJR08373.1 cyanovirin containing protein [Sinorhizobium meliloti]
MKVVIASALFTLTATAAIPSSSTFQNTCSNISFQYTDQGGAEISATCLRADGSPNRTSIAMPAIANVDGALELEGDSASFQKSCGSIELAPSISGVTLNASCRDTSGAFHASSIPIDGIQNSDGTLTN